MTQTARRSFRHNCPLLRLSGFVSFLLPVRARFGPVILGVRPQQEAIMHEIILKQFFEGSLSASMLAEDLIGSLVSDSPSSTRHPIVDMDIEFKVSPQHLIKLCDAVLSYEIESLYLQAIGFCLIASDMFFWDSDEPDGDVVAEALHDWSAPEINYPLTLSNVKEWRHMLKGERCRLKF